MGIQFVYVFPFFPGEKGEHLNKTPRKSQENARTVPGHSCEYYVHVFLVYCSVAGRHWTGSPNKSIDQKGKTVQKCPKIVFSAPHDNFWTFFRHSFGHFVDILFFWAVQRFARYKFMCFLVYWFFCLYINSKGQCGPGSVRFGCGLGVERFRRFRFSVPAVLLGKGVPVCFSTI